MEDLTRVSSNLLSRVYQYIPSVSSIPRYIYGGETQTNLRNQQQQSQQQSQQLQQEQQEQQPSNSDFLWKVESVIEEWKESESRGLSVCLVGRVSTGKSSLVSALFAPDPRENVPDHPLTGKIKVGAEGGTTQKPCAILADLGTSGGKLLIIDLPGLHDTPAVNNSSGSNSNRMNQSNHYLPNVSSLFNLLKKSKIDLGIFVIDGIPTDTSVEDFRRLQEISKKVFLVFNKIDTYDYLKPEKKAEIIETTRIKMGATQIFPTVCKGFDPEADRENPHWYDVRGVNELQEGICEFVKEYKHRELSEKMRNKEFWKNFQDVSIRAAISVGVFVVVLARAKNI